MSLVRFVHAADLHLDSPFKGMRAVSPAIAGPLREATFNTFDRIVDLCISEQVDALLVAGDIYDSADRSLRAQIRFIEGLERLDAAGIQSFICHGNHDPLDGWTARLRLPPSAHQFSAGIESVPIHGLEEVAVVGASFPQSNVTADLAANFTRPPDARFAIGLLHCNVGAASEHATYAPTTVATLAASGFDYWALGHIHTRQVLRERHPAIVYPGNPQGLHPRETGPRGVHLVEVDDGLAIRSQFKAVDTIRWSQIDVTIQDLESEQALHDAVVERITDELADAGQRPLIYRTNITGNGPLHESLTNGRILGDLVDHLNDRFGDQPQFAWCDRATAQTGPSLDRETRREAGDFLATVLQLTDRLLVDEDERNKLWHDLAPLLADARLRPYLKDAGLRDQDLIEIVAESERRIIGVLESPR